MRKDRWRVKVVLVGLVLLPLQAVGQPSPPPAGDTLTTRSASCDAIVVNGILGAYNGGTQSCADGTSGCRFAD
jgi:hypothetical protein